MDRHLFLMINNNFNKINKIHKLFSKEINNKHLINNNNIKIKSTNNNNIKIYKKKD